MTLITVALLVFAASPTDEDIEGGACFRVPEAFKQAQPAMAREYQVMMVQDAVDGRAETQAPAFKTAPVSARLMLTAIWVAAKRHKFVPLFEQMEKQFTYDPKLPPNAELAVEAWNKKKGAFDLLFAALAGECKVKDTKMSCGAKKGPKLEFIADGRCWRWVAFAVP